MVAMHVGVILSRINIKTQPTHNTAAAAAEAAGGGGSGSSLCVWGLWSAKIGHGPIGIILLLSNEVENHDIMGSIQLF